MEESLNRNLSGGSRLSCVESHVQRALSRQLEVQSSARRVSRCQRWVESSYFTASVSVLIGLNALMLGIETDHDFKTKKEHHWRLFGYLQEVFFVLVFTAELTLKIVVLGPRAFFFGEGMGFNIFDAFLVGLSIVELVFDTFLSSEADLRQVSVLRLLRLLRIMRVARFLRYFRQLAVFLTGVLHALVAIFWGIVLITLVTFMGAIFITRLMHEVSVEDEEMNIFWGSVGLSMFTLFQLSTGDSWASAIARPTMRHSPLAAAFLLSFFVLTSLVIMNALAAVIVENVLKTAIDSEQRRLQEVKCAMELAMRTIHDAFRAADANDDGMLSKEEYEMGLQMEEIQVQLNNADISIHDASELFDMMDVDKSGTICLEEWIEGCLRCRGPARSKDLMLIQYEALQLHTDQVNMMCEAQQQLARQNAQLERVESLADTVLAKLRRTVGGQHPRAHRSRGPLGSSRHAAEACRDDTE